jgi:nickel/cobalt exporter
MLSPEISVLISSAAVIAFVHTLMGPDHYLPFVSMGVARRWSIRKMLLITAGCGLGHIVGSIALGFAGVALQLQVGSLEWFESLRGDVAAWCLIAVGLVYFSWGLRRAYKNKPHSHFHSHGELLHTHDHKHHADHAHVHTEEATSKLNSIGPWAIFIIFVLGPCEPLIPLLMYPAAKESGLGLLLVTAVFGLVTMLTMLLAVYASAVGLKKVRVPGLEKYGHAMAGATIFACGSSIAFLGL